MVALNKKILTTIVLQRGFGLGDLSKKSGLSYRTIQRALTGRPIQFKTARKICAALDVTDAQRIAMTIWID